MYFRTFFFLLFIFTASLFFLSSLNPPFTLNLCGSMCQDVPLSLDYIQLTSMTSSALALILFLTTNHFTNKSIMKEKERIAQERLNIENIHAELEALKK
jgi:hypothetical protein